MQDVQNIPNPDVNSNETEDDFDSHPRNQDVEQPEENIPAPPDREENISIEEPPETDHQPPIDEPNTELKRIA